MSSTATEMVAVTTDLVGSTAIADRRGLATAEGSRIPPELRRAMLPV